MKVSNKQIADFKQKIWQYYRSNGRHDLPWRNTSDPYAIYISEIMLQQTQVGRVVPKYHALITALPHFEALATVDTATLLSLWQGLGYNRRALALKRSADIICTKYAGKLPKDTIKLQALPGVGPATAGSLRAFVFNLPSVFIETNIRRVFIDQFFSNQSEIADSELMPIVAQCMTTNSREWYWALMDYGNYLTHIKPNPNLASKHYAKQGSFKGSNREIRGKVIRYLVENGMTNSTKLKKAIDDPRFTLVINDLCHEGFIQKQGQKYTL